MLMARLRGFLKSPKGFTLIEIAIVVAIIGLLLAIALPLYSGARTRAYIAEARALTSEWKSLTWACLIEKSFDESLCTLASGVNWTLPQNSGAWNWQSVTMGCGAAATVTVAAAPGTSPCAANQAGANAYVAIKIPNTALVTNPYVLLINTSSGTVHESPADNTTITVTP